MEQLGQRPPLIELREHEDENLNWDLIRKALNDKPKQGAL